MISLSKVMTEPEVHSLLSDLFPDEAVETLTGFETRQVLVEPTIVFSVDPRPECEFPTQILFWRFEPADLMSALELARRLASTLQCRTIVDGTGFGDDESPFWSILWWEERAYLVDDSHSAYGDGEGGPVRIVRELSLESLGLE